MAADFLTCLIHGCWSTCLADSLLLASLTSRQVMRSLASAETPTHSWGRRGGGERGEGGGYVMCYLHRVVSKNRPSLETRSDHL